MKSGTAGDSELHTGVACAFVGGFPDPGRRDNEAYSPAGAFMQQRLVQSLRAVGLDVNAVFAQRTVRSFPRGPLLYGYRRANVGTGDAPAELMPFVNLPPLKQLTSGAALIPLVMRWGRKHRERPRILLCYNVGCPPGFAIALAARMSGAKAVALVADLEVPGSGLVPDNPARRADFWLQRSSLRWFDGLIVLTLAVAADHAADVPALHMEGAVPPELESAAALAGGNWADAADRARADRFVIMYAGDLSTLKGIPLLLEAFSRLEGDRYQLWITGKGPLAEQVEAAARADHRITFRGFPAYGEVLELFAAADVLVNPHSTSHASARYLFPSKLIEYLATGTPVVSTCSNAEVREYAPYLTLLEESTPSALADALRALDAMPRQERLRRGLAAREFVLANKTWTRQAARVRDFLFAIVER